MRVGYTSEVIVKRHDHEPAHTHKHTHKHAHINAHTHICPPSPAAADETQRQSLQWRSVVTALQISTRRMKKLTRLAVCSEAPLVVTKQHEPVMDGEWYFYR